MKKEISVKSFTYAMKGKRLLEKKAISAEVIKKAEDCGCIYLIRYDDKGSGFDVRNYLLSSGVKLSDKAVSP
ncbi:MAG: hypothetical protein IJD95_06200 [Clostridia bacterium]|nr:hypothetical protein [Clostridia bacterium]MBR2327733.1 hypothetical protein [Clostridia bacterium]